VNAKRGNKIARPTPERRLLDLKASAVYMGRPVSGLRRLINNGRLPFIQDGPGGKVWVDIFDLDMFIERSKRREGRGAF
jgi:hypothetical protein